MELKVMHRKDNEYKDNEYNNNKTTSNEIETQLSGDLLERVLNKLGVPKHPQIDLDGLSRVYDSWCRHVPFDNSRKLIHVNANDPGPLPGDTPEDFFEYWLKHGAGGTCWAGNGALFALLHTLGFPCSRGVATMLVAPGLPPNHGTVIATFSGKKYIVDASILHKKPLLLVESSNESDPSFPPWVKNVYLEGSHWHIVWRPIHRLNQITCRIDYSPAELAEFQTWHEKTRVWSPFNFELNIRRVIENKILGIHEGKRVELNSAEIIRHEFASSDERNKFLIEELKLSEEHVSLIPPDRPTPPPPGTKTAQELERSQMQKQD